MISESVVYSVFIVVNGEQLWYSRAFGFWVKNVDERSTYKSKKEALRAANFLKVMTNPPLSFDVKMDASDRKSIKVLKIHRRRYARK